MSNIEWNGEPEVEGLDPDFLVDDQPYEESEVFNEAIKRIEQAKLYESLIKHDFFAPGSARPEIQDKVTKEIRDFIMNRLEILVGLKQSDQLYQGVISSPFNEDEVEALKVIAGKLIQKNTQPVLSAPQVNKYTEPSTDPVVVKTRPANPVVNQVKAPINQTQAKRPVGRPKTKEATNPPAPPEPRPEGGIYKPQAVSKAHPPKKMPTQAEINALHQMEVARREASRGKGGAGDQLLTLAIKTSQHINRNVDENID